MGNKRKWTAAKLKKAVNEYFDSISAERPKRILVPVMEEDGEGRMIPVKDDKGHALMAYEQVTAKNGTPATETIWIRPPGIVDLCLFLGVHRSTFFRWCGLLEEKGDELTEEEEKLCNIATRARGRIESYLTARSEDRDAQRGVLANLEANFGWKRRKEVGLDEQTRKSMETAAVLTTEEKLAKLAEMGLVIPGLED